MLHHTDREFIRIIEELKEQELHEDERQDKDYKMIIKALRMHAEGEQQLNKQIGRLIHSTKILALTQITLVAISIVVAIILGIRV